MGAPKPVQITYGSNPNAFDAPEPLIVVGGSGRVTLAAGTATVSAPGITANTNVRLYVQSLGTVTAPKAIAVTSRVVGTSFTITSSDNTDTSVIAYDYSL